MRWSCAKPAPIAFRALLFCVLLGQYLLGVSEAAAEEPGDQPIHVFKPAPHEALETPPSSGPGRRPPISRKTAKVPEEHEEHTEHEPHLKNNIGVGFAYVSQWLHEGEAHERNPASLYGFSLFYERVFIPGHLALSIRKPFVFDRDRFDSPLGIALEGLWQRKHWELFLGTGLGLNVRIFEQEQEGDPDGAYVSFSIPVLGGVNLLLTHHWSLQAEVCYNWVATDEPVNFEVEAFLTALYHF